MKNNKLLIISIYLLFYGLCIEGSLIPEAEVLDIKAVQSKSSHKSTITAIGDTPEQNIITLQDIGEELYNFFPGLTKQLDFQSHNPFLENYENAHDFIVKGYQTPNNLFISVKRLFMSLNISTKGILYQENLSYFNAKILRIDDNFLKEFYFKELTSLCIILLEIIKTPSITLEQLAKEHESAVNVIFNFVKENLFKKISIQSNVKNEVDLFERVNDAVGLTEILNTIPIVPYDAIILLAKILTDDTRNTLVALKEKREIFKDDFYNIYYKIEFLNNNSFNKSTKFFENFLKQFNSDIYKSDIYKIENSFINIFLSSIKNTKNAEINIEKITKKILIKMYESALHMIFLFGYSIENSYMLNNEMSIVEICAMFLRLEDALKRKLLSNNTNYTIEIKEYNKLRKKVQKEFVNTYRELKDLYNLEDDQLIARLKQVSIPDYTYDDIQLLFSTKPFILESLLNNNVPPERLDKKNWELLGAITSYWLIEIHKNKLNRTVSQKEQVDSAILNTAAKTDLRKESLSENDEREETLQKKRLETKKLNLENQLLKAQLKELERENKELKSITPTGKFSSPLKQTARYIQQSTKTSESSELSNVNISKQTEKDLSNQPNVAGLVGSPSSTKNENKTKKIEGLAIQEFEQKSNTQQSWFSYIGSWFSPWAWYTWYYGIQE